jgi:hypothetical protein
VRIDGRVSGNMKCMEESGFVGRNQVLLQGIRLCWNESGFVGCVVNMA